MKIDLNKILSFAIIAIGLSLFFINIKDQLPIAFIAIIGMFLLWILWNKVAGSFILSHLIYLISCVGLIIAVSILIFYGIEPIGTRNGTLMRFHSNHIAMAMGIFFITLLPYIILNMKIQLPVEKLKVSLKPAFIKSKTQKDTTKTNQYVVNDQNWEIVSEEEALSGYYTID